MAKQPHILLVGLMGSGKSSVGRILSQMTGRLFSDTDAMVEAFYRMTIPKIFEELGEDSFRQFEHEMIELALDDQRPGIISTGGGAVARSENRVVIWEKSWVVYLKARPDELITRLKLDGSRPLLQQDDPLGVLKDLYKKRSPHYRNAHWTIDVGDTAPRDAAKAILKEYKKQFGPARNL